ncbi:MAG: hypothetical protein HC903_26660 [Methylacidiphilales bacterium]|nr:hypothetical protein [Candidatus Methylacidiphilales bacterium]
MHLFYRHRAIAFKAYSAQSALLGYAISFGKQEPCCTQPAGKCDRAFLSVMLGQPSVIRISRGYLYLTSDARVFSGLESKKTVLKPSSEVFITVALGFILKYLLVKLLYILYKLN